MKPRYIQETFEDAIERVPELESMRNSTSVSAVFDIADCMDGYDLFQVVTAPLQPLLLIYKAKPTAESTD